MVEKGQGCTVTLTAEEGYVLDTVKVTMGGADITASVYAGGKVTIGAVTGHVVITARAVVREESRGIFFVAATVSGGMINAYALPSNRISMVTDEAVADTPFPQNGNVHDGDVYLIPVPVGMNVLTVESPGLIGGPQFFNLENGVYTCALDAGWRTEDGFTYEFEADAYDFVAINFKNMENSNFYTADYDTSGITAAFSWAEPEQEDTEVPVTLSLTRTSVTNNQRKVQMGASYNTMFVPADGCFLDKVTVTMDGTDVTAEVYKDGKIAIGVVTGAILVLAVSAEEPGPVEIQDIMMGSTSFVEDAGLQIHRVDTMTHRATLVPVGQYLKKGSTYRFSLGGAEGFSYGVQIMVASSAGLVFDSTEGIEVYHNTVVSREVDTGWMSTDYTYTPAEHNRIFTMNFKYGDAAMDESHYQQLLENVVVEEVTV